MWIVNVGGVGRLGDDRRGGWLVYIVFCYVDVC